MRDIGTKAPDFSLKNSDGQEIRLSDLLKKGHVVLYFYPKNETPGCTKEACAFRDQYEDFKEAGAEVVGISADSTNSHAKFVQNRNLPFVLLSDPKFEVHKLYDASPSLFGILRSRVTYVIDQTGTIRHAFSSQFNIGRHIDDALEKLRELPNS